MKKSLGLALALLLTLSLAATAAEVTGKVKTIDRAGNSFILEDGTTLWVSETHITDLALGDQVQAVYETRGDKKIVTDLDHRTVGPDGQGTTNFGTLFGTPNDIYQAGAE